MLRLRDNTLILSASSLERIIACPRQAYYSLVRDRISAKSQPAQRLGRIIHSALAFRFRCEFYNIPYENKQDSILTYEFSKDPCELEEYRNLNLASQVIHAFNKEYPQRWGVAALPTNPRVPFVERTFAIEAGTVMGVKILFIGVIDLVSTSPDGLFVEDWKTTSRDDESTWAAWSISEQFRGYCWALAQATGICPLGFKVNALIIRKPSRTGVGIEFKRITHFVAEPPGILDEWHENMLAQCEEFLYWHKQDRYPMFRGGHCVHKYGKCDYFDVCALSSDQRETLLLSDKYKQHKMNPKYT